MESGATRRDMELERADDKQCEDGVWRRRIEERRPARDPFSGRLAARTDLSVLWCVEVFAHVV